MTVQLTPELERFLQDQVSAGRFATVDDAVVAAVALLQTGQQIRDLDALRAEVDIGIAEADRGEFVEFTAEDVIAERRIARRKGA